VAPQLGPIEVGISSSVLGKIIMTSALTSAFSEAASLDIVRHLASQPTTESSTAKVHLTGSSPANTFSIVEFASKPGNEPAVIKSASEDRFFCLLEGEWDVQVGDENFRVKAGSSFYAPRGLPYSYRILTPSARAIVLITCGPQARG
jgi:quercetin dioxygenase-like cupin family protein